MAAVLVESMKELTLKEPEAATQGSAPAVYGLGFRVQGVGFRVEGSRFRVEV